ncbi:MAG: Flp pilus assembly protein CpaB [Candidatus Wallbacteria bacterium]|nr:Flp pilus assembly protein CpaB [Candidatus Wallbacteria bacterium]
MIGAVIFIVILLVSTMTGGPEAPPPAGSDGTQGQPGDAAGKPPAPPEDLIETVVAKVTIPKQKQIKPEMIDVVKVPSSLRSSDAVTNVKDVLDHYSLVRIFEKEQILRVRLGESASADVGMAYVIGRGKRAVSVPMQTDRAVGGYVSPGTTVDILGTFRTTGGMITRRVLSKKKILAINDKHIIEKAGAKPAPKAPEPGKDGEPAKEQGFQQIENIQSVTFELSPVEGEKLLMASQNGSLTLEIVHPESASTELRPVHEGQFKTEPGQDAAATEATPTQQVGPPPVRMVEIIRYKTKDVQAVGVRPPTTSAPAGAVATGTPPAVAPQAPSATVQGQLPVGQAPSPRQ